MENNNYRYYPLKDDDLDTNTNDTNNTLIWLDEEALNLTSPNTRLTIDMFKSITNTNYKSYNSSELFLTEIENLTKTTRVIIITSGCFAEKLLPELSLSLLREVSSIFIFCKDSTNYQCLLKKYRKVIDICTDEQLLKEAIQDELYPLTNFLIMDRDLKPIFSLKHNSLEFDLYKQYIKILKYYPWSSDNREKMLNECTKYYRKNNAQKRKIEEFKYTYTPETAIKWYTRDSFLYRLVNKALRSLDMEQINVFRPFIKDLCKQLEHLHEQNQSDTPLTVFRGHGDMTMHQFEKIKENIGALISFNGFLSTTTDYNVAVIFAGSPSTENISVIFEIRTNYNLKNVVFADISKLSDTEDEKEVLFSLCSIFRIDDITDDEENQLSKIIMSATDEDAINIPIQINDEIIPDERKHRLYCINQYCRKQYVIKAFAAIFFIMIVALGIIFGINTKLKDQTRSLYNCVGLNCTTFSATTTTTTTTTVLIKPQSSAPIPEYSTTVSTVSTKCVPVGWSSEVSFIINGNDYGHFAVDNDLNIYVVNKSRKRLEKLLSSGVLLTSLFDGDFLISTPLFFHFSSQSLYFCYVLEKKMSVYKITNENSTMINAIDNITAESRQTSQIYACDGLYVNLLGEIYIFDYYANKVCKWAINSTSAIVVADGRKTDNSTSQTSAFAVDGYNNIIYLFSIFDTRILKYTEESLPGITIINKSTIEMLYRAQGRNINLLSIAVDKSGYIILGERKRISMWRPNGEFHGIAIERYQDPQFHMNLGISAEAIVFDRLGNLYVGPEFGSMLVRFDRDPKTCTNHIS